jgi:cytosine/adenosine deaminase-related metal-dependent hydrolase
LKVPRTLVTGGHVLTMDPALGEFPRADVLIENGAISAVGPNLDAPGADISTPRP